MATYTSTLLAQSNDAKDIQKADLDLLKKINEVNDRIDISDELQELQDISDELQDVSDELQDVSDELQELQDIVKTLVNFNDIYPIGSIFIQFPSHNDPGTMFPGTVWLNISSSFPGAFFRAEGGKASAFNAGKQGWQVGRHNHGGSCVPNDVVHEHPQRMSGTGSGGYQTGGAGTGPVVAGYIPGGVTARTDKIVYTAGGSVSHGHSVSVDYNLPDGYENIPDNYTMRIWERRS